MRFSISPRALHNIKPSHVTNHFTSSRGIITFSKLAASQNTVPSPAVQTEPRPLTNPFILHSTTDQSTRTFSTTTTMSSENKMEYTRLGKSGLKISKVILGAMSFGSPDWQGWVLPEEEALPLLEHAYKVGLNTWDTADVYSNGKSEEIIGKALKKYSIPRSKVVILSKCYFGVDPTGAQPPISASSTNDGDNVNQVGLSRKHIFDAVDASVQRLGTYIDVLQIHRLDRDTPREEIMKALNDVIESGKVRYIGASSMAAWEFQTLQNIASRHGWHQFISMQNYYNLLYREEEREMIPYCRDTGVGCIPWSPIARGVLTRPWATRDTKREKTDNFLKTLIRSRENDIDKAIVDRVEQVAKKHGVSMATVATAWVLSKSGVNPIIGLSSKERIDEAVKNAKFKLPDEDIQFLEESYLPKPVTGY
ncbi:aldo-keto reductase-like protein [Xylona heveae TC161]|uniref:Aldo-keto reductase-like protein n=1 Tax=Xylona heveae (strain CBS 132557 / TC161) TaxID=1328760 RepID=A0A165IIN8_XYLHT|nr:aldo-keto reductase-like protein [Xylona heveae TC161]KZF24948.1 aldo-keto reductase-like protein [Xylona heveae TC161]